MFKIGQRVRWGVHDGVVVKIQKILDPSGERNEYIVSDGNMHISFNTEDNNLKPTHSERIACRGCGIEYHSICSGEQCLNCGVTI